MVCDYIIPALSATFFSVSQHVHPLEGSMLLLPMGDPFMTRRDYAKGILYSSRRVYLCDETPAPPIVAEPAAAGGWQDGDRMRPPRALMSKSQIRRDLMRKRRASQGPQVLKRLAFLEKIQAASDKSQLTRAIQDRRAKEKAERIKAMALAEERSLKRLSAAEALAKANASGTVTSSPAASARKGSLLATLKGGPRGSTSSLPPIEGALPGNNQASAGQGGQAGGRAAIVIPPGWDHVTDQGHPYWLNRATGEMSFFSPSTDSTTPQQENEEDEDEGMLEDDHFKFLDTWTAYKTPKFLKGYQFT